MHSRWMSRRADSLSQANVAIGDKFKVEKIKISETSKKLSEHLRKHGDVDLSAKGRLFAMYQRIRAGKFPNKQAAILICRDHAKEFAEWDRQASKFNGNHSKH